MKRITISELSLLMFVLSACQATTFTHITDGVRTATTYDNSSKNKVVVQTIEMLDGPTGKWFEAEKLADGTFVLTQRGQAARTEFMANEESASGGY